MYFPPWTQTQSPASVYFSFMFLFLKYVFLNNGKKIRIVYHRLNLHCKSPSVLHICTRHLHLIIKTVYIFSTTFKVSYTNLCTRIQPVNKFITASKCLGTPSIYCQLSQLFNELQPYLYRGFFYAINFNEYYKKNTY